MSDCSEDDKMNTTLVKLPPGYSQMDSLDGVFGSWGKLMRIVQSHLNLARVTAMAVIQRSQNDIDSILSYFM